MIYLLDFNVKECYNKIMNDFEDNSILDDEEDEDIPEVEVISTQPPVISTVSPTYTHQNQQLPVLSTDAIASEVAERELQLRRLELQEWAQKKKILKGAPKVRELNRVWRKLRKGLSINKAIKGVVSISTWHKWREEYPEIAAMEEQCYHDRLDKLQDTIHEVANNKNISHGAIERDRTIMAACDKEMDRIEDRLTANRMQKGPTNPTHLTPIQINFAFRKKKQ